MINESTKPSLSDAAESFLLTLPSRERSTNRQEIHKFVSWFGANHALSGLTGVEIAHYADRLSLPHADHTLKLEPIRAFLAFAKKQGWTRNNLSVNLRARKASPGRLVPVRVSKEPSGAVLLTQKGLDDLKTELEELKSRRPAIIEEIQRAAADKDFRENVPLHAARESKSHLEGRIMELEAMLKSAVVIEGQSRSTVRVSVGDTIILCNIDSGKECRYTLVSPREVDAARGRISCVSPIGQAVVNREQGEIVEVVAPAGRIRYSIKWVER